MLSFCYPGRDEIPDWNNFEILNRNASPACSYLIPFPDQSGCIDAVSNHRRYLSPYIHMLNGLWNFKYFEQVNQIPERILSFRSGFDSIPVPCYWQEQAYGKNKDSNYSSDFPFIPPIVNSRQGAAVYHKTVTLPLRWNSYRKRLVLLGVKKAFHLYVNGKMAGFFQQGNLPVYFDITQNWHEGENDIFIIVYENSCDSYLDAAYSESSDSNHNFHGIFRDLYLEAVPSISLFDINISTKNTDLSFSSWEVYFDARIISYRISQDKPEINLSLHFQGKSIAEHKYIVNLKSVDDQSTFSSPVQTTGLLTKMFVLKDIIAWTDETPAIYDLFITVKDSHGNEQACYHQPIGFRQIENKQNQISINNKLLKLKSICYHQPMFSQCKKSVLDQISTDLIKIKRAGFNCVYLADFPADPAFYDLTDMIGLYVICKSDIFLSNAFLTAQSPEELTGNNQKWNQHIADRIQRFIKSIRNHSSIIGWDAGENVEKWPDFDYINKQIKKLDSNRLILNSNEFLSSDQAKYLLCSLTDKKGNFNTRGQNLIKQLLPLEIKFLTTEKKLSVTNKLTFAKLSNISINWQLYLDNNWQEQGQFESFDLIAGENVLLDLPETEKDSFEAHLNCLVNWHNNSFIHKPLKQSNKYYFEIKNQFNEPLLPPSGQFAAISHGKLRIEKDRHLLLLSGHRFWLIFNRINGELESWRCGETELLESERPGTSAGPVWKFFARSKDRNCLEHQRFCHIPISIKHACDGECAVIEIESVLARKGSPTEFTSFIRYEINMQGQLNVFATISCSGNNSTMPDYISLEFGLKRQLNLLQWYGKDEDQWLMQHNTLLENNTDSLVKVSESDLTISENGVVESVKTSGTECSWLFAHNEQGLGIMIQSDNKFAFNSYLCSSIPDKSISSNQFFNRHWHQFDLEFAGNVKTTICKRQFTLQPMVISMSDN